MVVLTFSVIFCLFTASFSLVLDGPCPKITGVPLNLEKMIGIWHQYAVSVSRYDPLQICANQIWLPPKNYVSTVKLISRSKTTHETLKSLAEMYMTRNNVLKVNNHIPIVGNAPYEVVVLGIDYINFGITWGCMSRGQNKHEEILSLYTRQVKPLIDVVKMTKKIMAEYNLTMPELVFTDQNC